MKKIVLSILLSICLFAVCAVNVMGASVDCQNDGSGKTLITGSAEAGESVTLRIFKKKNHLDEDGKFSYSKAQADLRAAVKAKNIQSVLCFADETVAGSDGKFTFEAKISRLMDSDGLVSTDAISDVYIISAVSASGKVESEFLFVDPTERAGDYRTLSGMKDSTKQEVVSFLDAHKYALGVYVPSLGSIDVGNAYAIMYDYLVSGNFDVADSVDDEKNNIKNLAAALDMQKIFVIEALNQSKLIKIDDYESELMLEDSEIYNWYTDELVDDNFRAAITTRLSDRSFDDIDEFDDAFIEAVVLQWIASSDGVDDCMGIVGDFREDIGYDKDDVIEEGAVREAMGTSFDDYSDLKSALDSYEGEDEEGDEEDEDPPSRGGVGFGGSSVSKPVQTPPQAINTYFNDLGSASWAIESINYLAEKNILQGKANGIFAPNDNVTRAEFAKILVTAFNLTQKSDAQFADVSEDSWYSEFVKLAVGSGIAKGTGADTFGPDENITRQDMAVMLLNAAKIAKGMTESESDVDFADKDSISGYAKSAVNTLACAGIINGTGDGNFAPRAYATRAQAAKLVHGLLTY